MGLFGSSYGKPSTFERAAGFALNPLGSLYAGEGKQSVFGNAARFALNPLGELYRSGERSAVGNAARWALNPLGELQRREMERRRAVLRNYDTNEPLQPLHRSWFSPVDFDETGFG